MLKFQRVLLFFRKEKGSIFNVSKPVMVMLMYRLPEASFCWIQWEIRWFISLSVSPCMFIYNSTVRIKEMFVYILF